MKKAFLLLLSIFILSSCSKGDKDNITEDYNSIVILKVDYMTNKFEGGYEQQVNSFGNISLYYKPTNDLLFDGSIIWMGTGTINYPKIFIPASKYSLLESPITKPEDSKFKCIFGTPPTDYSLIWNSINRLTIVSNCLDSKKKIDLFLYTPSVGAGNPNDWDWIIVMNRTIKYDPIKYK
ncbi:MAG: hypothetical protein H6Q15_2576 [Bacteroidetes bacterium]|nr:hypothetical protein [Bacteroidota bacterium]